MFFRPLPRGERVGVRGNPTSQIVDSEPPHPAAKRRLCGRPLPDGERRSVPLKGRDENEKPRTGGAGLLVPRGNSDGRVAITAASLAPQRFQTALRSPENLTRL